MSSPSLAASRAVPGSGVRGPISLMLVIDKSGSMEGQPDLWATAVALALLERAWSERRPFALLGFDASVNLVGGLNLVARFLARSRLRGADQDDARVSADG